MIDLTKNQIVEPAIECWVWNDDKKYAKKMELLSIDHRRKWAYTVLTRFSNEVSAYVNCSLIDPNKPKVKKWETVMDVPVELWGRALVKYKSNPAHCAVNITPADITNNNGDINTEMHYLPLGQPLDSEWLEFEEEIIEQ